MARVPQAQPAGALGSVAPTQGPAVFDSTRASEAFGASPDPIGEALQQFGGQVVDLAINEQQENNKRELDEALVQFTKEKNAIGYGDGSAQNPGFYGLNGEAALQADPDTRGKLIEAQDLIGKNLSNDLIRQEFLIRTAELSSNEMARYSRHSDAQRKVANEATAASVINESMDDALLNYTEDLVIANSLENAAEAAIRVSIQAGEGSEAAASKGEAARSAVAKASIEGAIAGRNIARARELFDEFAEKNEDTGKAVLEGDDLISTAKFLANAVGLEAAQRYAGAAAAFATQPDGTIDIDIATDMLRSAPELKGQPLDDALTQLGILISETDAIKEQRMDTSESSLNQHLAGGGDLVEWTSKNSSLWEELQGDSNTAERIRDYEQFLARGQQFNPVSDGQTWSNLIRNREGPLEEVNLDTYKGQLTEDEFNRLVKSQQAAQGAGANGQTNSQVRAIHDNAKSIMFRVGNTIPILNDDDDPQLKADLRLSLEREMAAFVQSFTDQGKEPSKGEILTEATRLIMQIQTGQPAFFSIFNPDNFFAGIAANKPRLTIEQQGSAVVPVDRMTDLQKIEWTEVYRRVGIEPTDGMLEQIGGAIAMNDASRLLRLLTPRVKESE